MPARVATRGDDHGNEQGQDGGQLQVEVSEDRYGRHLPQEEKQQPGPPLLHHLAYAGLHVRLPEGVHAGQLVDVLGGLLLRHVGHVVPGHDAHEDAVAVHDREGKRS